MPEILESDKVIEIPVEVSVCPYCGKKLTISPDGWVQEEDGSWTCDSFNSWCEDEPDIEDGEDEWEAHLQTHSDMPYVYQLPVDTKILEWLKARYRFNLDDKQQSEPDPELDDHWYSDNPNY